LPEGLRIYSVGDVHGCASLLEQAFTAIDEDLQGANAGTAIEVYLGDYIDRGPASRTVLDLLIERRRKCRVVCLKGNHEAFLLDVLNDPQKFEHWRQFGGLATLRSYGIQVADTHSTENRNNVIANLASALPVEHLNFLFGLVPCFQCGDYFFVHAGVKPGVSLAKQIESDMISIRNEFLHEHRRFEKFIVHGHTPVREPDIRNNRINIDTGAYATGRLAMLILEGDTKRVVVHEASAPAFS
jgi:serine/threonine protein phosphatase 1